MQTREAIGRFMLSRKAANLKPISISFYSTKLEKFARECPTLPTKPEPIEAFLAHIEGADETKDAYWRTLRAFFNFVSERANNPNPMRLVRRPIRDDLEMPTLEPVDLSTILAIPKSKRDQALLTLLMDTGIRASQLCGLRWQDIGTSTIRVYAKRRLLSVPISEETRNQMLSLRRQKSRPDDYVFRNRSGKPLTRSGVYHITSKYLREIGVTGSKVGPHRLRHTFGKQYLVEGGDLRSLQNLLGHSSIKTTERYTNLNMQNLIDKHHQFTPLKAAHKAAQGLLFDPTEVIREAEEILSGSDQKEEA